MSERYDTRILPADEDGIAEAARLILAGETVAVPTETVYGLAADATNAEAVARIYEAKGRPSFNPLIVHVLDMAEAEALGARPDDTARRLAADYWPGPLTLVVPMSPFGHIAPAVTAGLDTIAVRSPEHPVMRALLQATGRPLAAPSANASGSISSTRAEHVMRSLGGRIPLILNGGPCEKGIESTIVKVAGDRVEVLREGPIEGAHVAIFAKMYSPRPTKANVEAPGMLASHYAPSKPLRLNATEAEPDEYWIDLGDNLEAAAANLFDALHAADQSGKPRIAVAPVPEEGIGIAINDRLRRAAAPRS